METKQTVTNDVACTEKIRQKYQACPDIKKFFCSSNYDILVNVFLHKKFALHLSIK